MRAAHESPVCIMITTRRHHNPRPRQPYGSCLLCRGRARVWSRCMQKGCDDCDHTVLTPPALLPPSRYPARLLTFQDMWNLVVIRLPVIMLAVCNLGEPSLRTFQFLSEIKLHAKPACHGTWYNPTYHHRHHQPHSSTPERARPRGGTREMAGSRARVAALRERRRVSAPHSPYIRRQSKFPGLQ